jgi:hypothetical protein
MVYRKILGYDKIGKPLRQFDVVEVPSRRSTAILTFLKELNNCILDYQDGSIDLVTSVGFDHLRRV